MDAVTHDLNRHLRAMDAKEALEDAIESELERIETNFQQRLKTTGVFLVDGFDRFNAWGFLQFLTLEEFHPIQGYRWLAVKQLVHDCNDENARLSGWEIINYASKRGYCNG